MTYATRIPHTAPPMPAGERAAFRIGYAHGRANTQATRDRYHATRNLMRKMHYALNPDVNFHPTSHRWLHALSEGLTQGTTERERRGARVNPHLS